MWLNLPAKNLSHFGGIWLCDYTFMPKFYPTLRGLDYVIKLSSRKSITFWGNLTMYLYFSAKNLSHSEMIWLCYCVLRNEIYPILRGPDSVIIFFRQKRIPFWGGDQTMWMYPMGRKLSHSEETWLFDYTFQSKIVPNQWGPDYVILISSHKSVPFWGELTMWLYFPAKILSRSEGTWLYDYIFQPKFYPILRGLDCVITSSSQKSIPFWGDLTMWLYFPAKNLSQSEWTWPCNYTSQPKIYPILRGTWICDNTFQPKIKNLTNPSGPHYKIILSSQKYIPFWGDLTMWLCF